MKKTKRFLITTALVASLLAATAGRTTGIAVPYMHFL
jgi:hypothetical protein